MNKIAFLLPYANPHVMGWVDQLTELALVRVGVLRPVEKYRRGYFSEEEKRDYITKLYNQGSDEFQDFVKHCDAFVLLGIFEKSYLKYGQLLPKKCQVYVMSEPFNPFSSSRKSLSRKLYTKLFRQLYPKISFLCMGGVDVMNYYRKLGFKNSRYFNFGYFPKVELNEKASVNEEKSGPVRFLYLGQLIERKGIHKLLAALERLSQVDSSEFQVSIAGDGPLIDSVQDFCTQYSNCDFLGLITDHGDVVGLLKASDVLILPSIFDGWGAVINEAIAAGCAVIASQAVYAARTLVTHGVNGYILDSRYPEQLYEFLLDYAQQPSKAREHGLNSKAVYSDWNYYSAAEKFHKLVSGNLDTHNSLLAELT